MNPRIFNWGALPAPPPPDHRIPLASERVASEPGGWPKALPARVGALRVPWHRNYYGFDDAIYAAAAARAAGGR